MLPKDRSGRLFSGLGSVYLKTDGGWTYCSDRDDGNEDVRFWKSETSEMYAVLTSISVARSL